MNHSGIYRLTVYFHLAHALRMDVVEALPDEGFESNHNTGDLDSTAGTSGTGTYEHEQNQNGLG